MDKMTSFLFLDDISQLGTSKQKVTTPYPTKQLKIWLYRVSNLALCNLQRHLPAGKYEIHI